MIFRNSLGILVVFALCTSAAADPNIPPPLPEAVRSGHAGAPIGLGLGYPGMAGGYGGGIGGGIGGYPGENGLPYGGGIYPGNGMNPNDMPPMGTDGGIGIQVQPGYNGWNSDPNSSGFVAFPSNYSSHSYNNYGQSTGSMPRAYLHNNGGCPFARDRGNDANALIGGVINALSDLQNKCPSLEQSIRNFQTQAQHMNTMMMQQGDVLRPDGTADVNCSNFEYVLRREYDFVVTYPKQLQTAQRYYACAMQLEDNRQQCIDQQYAETLSVMAFQCKEKFKVATRENLKKGLQSFVQQANTLIQESDRCGSSGHVAQIMTNIGINTLSTIGAIAPMAGLSGAVLGMGGQLLNSLVNKLFSKTSPKEGIKALYNEMEAENISCLWYSLQNRALNCAQRSASLAQPRMPELACRNAGPGIDQKSVTAFANLDQILAGSVRPEPSWGQSLLAALEIPVDDPAGKPGQQISLGAFLGSMRDTLGQSKNITDQQYASQLDSFLNSVASLRSSLEAVRNAPMDRRREILNSATSEVKKTLLSTEQKAVRLTFSLPKIAEAYWSHQGKGDEFNRIRALNSTQNLIANGYQIALASKTELMAPDDYQQDLAIASNYMVENFQEYFSDRLKKLNDRYERNKDIGDRAQRSSDLMPLFKMCSQMAGVFYAKPVSDPIVDRTFNEIRDRPLEPFEKACGRFNCEKGPKTFSLFAPQRVEGPNTAQKFRAYQCSAVEDYTANKAAFLKQLESSGTPCNEAP